MLYIMNSPILTAPGKYVYELIDIERARRLLKEPFESAIGHEATAQFMSRLLGVEIPVNRVSIAMRPGDVAVIFRVKQRLEEGRVLTEEELRNTSYEIGLLRREE